MVDDGHDATIDFANQWANYWFLSLFNDTNLDDNRTLILLTFDETETYTVDNHISALQLGGLVTESAHGKADSTYCALCPSLSAVEENWGAESLSWRQLFQFDSAAEPKVK